MNQNQVVKAQDIAMQMAQGAMIRALLNTLAPNDPDEFRLFMIEFEKNCSQLLGDKPFDQTNEFTNTFILEAARSYISRSLATIRR